jgi:putative phosphonate transport system ATP-binding protein
MNMQVNPQELALDPQPLLSVAGVSRFYGERIGCAEVSFDLWPGEVLGIVGESGSGKSTLLRCLAGIDEPDEGEVLFQGGTEPLDIYSVAEQERRRLMRTAWGIVHQNPRDGLRMDVSAGGNVGERLMDNGARHYGRIRASALDWLQRVEIAAGRIDDRPRQFSGGMQQRLQIARVLVSEPKLVFMDEPTGGLDVSVQARLLDLLRVLVRDLHLAAIIVTHDLAVARLLTDRLMVMKDGRVVEQGLTDQVLDDPQHAYTQLLTSAVLSV